jgi:hypothetical protein
VEVQNLKVLVCGASNLSVDNLVERLVPHKIPLIRLGHPARVLSELHGATLDAQAEASDEAALAKDVRKEIEGVMGQLTGNGKKGRVKGAERKKMWEGVRELRKECVRGIDVCFELLTCLWTGIENAKVRWLRPSSLVQKSPLYPLYYALITTN